MEINERSDVQTTIVHKFKKVAIINATNTWLIEFLLLQFTIEDCIRGILLCYSTSFVINLINR